MTFGSQLQGQSSHAALIQRQDAEIKLLECFKKCLNMRIKAERDYANALTNIVTTANKTDFSAQDSPVFKCWSELMEQTAQIAHHINDNTGRLCTDTLEKLIQLTSELKNNRKIYVDSRQMLETEFTKLKDNITRLKNEYEKQLKSVTSDKNKYEELVQKGKAANKIEEARTRYQRSATKLHRLHNEYIVAVNEASMYQNSYISNVLPSLLSYQQWTQEYSIRHLKEILRAFTKLTDCTDDTFLKCHSAIQKSIGAILPSKEYGTFLTTNESPALESVELCFQSELLKCYEGQLTPDQIQLDDLTAEALQQIASQYDQKMMVAKQMKESKSEEIRETEAKLKLLPNDKERSTEQKNMARNYDRSLCLLGHEQTELRCNETRYKTIHQLVSKPLQRLGDDLPKCGLDLPNANDANALQNSKADATGGSTKKPTLSSTTSTSSAISTTPSRYGISGGSTASTVGSSVSSVKTTSVGSTSASLPPTTPASDTNNTELGDGSDEVFSGRETLSRKFAKTFGQIKMNFGRKSDSTPPKPPSKAVFEEPSATPSTAPAAASRSNSAKSQHMQELRSQLSNVSGCQGSDTSSGFGSSSNGAGGYHSFDSGVPCIEDEDWYHGVLPRKEVERLLQHKGDYLMRMSHKKDGTTAHYVLSVGWKDEADNMDYKHFIIQGEEGAWHLEGSSFPTIGQLIRHQHNSGGAVTKKSGVILYHAVVRESWELSSNDIQLKDKIGTGNFGDVFKGMYRGEVVAVKTCKEEIPPDLKKVFLREGAILRKYTHPNIVRLIGITTQKHPVMIVMEYVKGGALLKYLKERGTQCSDEDLLHMCIDAANGMQYLAAQNCIHRDLACRNCLIDAETGDVKIADFGMSKEDEVYVVSKGLKQIPIKWTAPEALNFGKYTSACDVWSFGVLMWEIFSLGETPYPGLSNTQAREKIEQGHRMPAPMLMSYSIECIMNKCWEYDPADRPSFNAVHSDLKRCMRR